MERAVRRATDTDASCRALSPAAALAEWTGSSDVSFASSEMSVDVAAAAAVAQILAMIPRPLLMGKFRSPTGIDASDEDVAATGVACRVHHTLLLRRLDYR